MSSSDEFRTVSVCLLNKFSEVYRSIPAHEKMPSEMHLRQFQERELQEATKDLRSALQHLDRFTEGD